MKWFWFIIGMMIGWNIGFNTAHAHDIWTRAKEYNRPNGFPCCGGNPNTGDCEGLGADDVYDNPDGSVDVFSHRYGARIRIAASRIHTDVPRDPDTKQPLDELTRFYAHLCAKPRTGTGGYGYPITEDDPDPNYHLFCFFRNGNSM